MMIQGNYARAALAKLIKDEDDRFYPAKEVNVAIRELVLWVDMLERKLELVEIDAKRPRFYGGGF
jgi:hypothetical protein